MKSEQPVDFSPSPGYDWVCYNFYCRTPEQTEELHEYIEDDLIHTALGVNITDELPTRKYNVQSAMGRTVRVYADTKSDTRKKNLTDLIKETLGDWSTAAIALGYDDDKHGEAAAFNYIDYSDTLEITAIFTGNPDYRAWDVYAALQPHFESNVYWQIEHPAQFYTMIWPAPDRGEFEPGAYRPDDHIEVGHALENHASTEIYE